MDEMINHYKRMIKKYDVLMTIFFTLFMIFAFLVIASVTNHIFMALIFTVFSAISGLFIKYFEARKEYYNKKINNY